MKYSIFIEPGREEEIIIFAHGRTALIEKIEDLVRSDDEQLMGYDDGGVTWLSPDEVICFTVENGRVYALTLTEKLLVKQRLYQLEERFSSDFVKINQSCLVRIDKIKRFHSSIGGSLTVTLVGGYQDYVSRRQLKSVKERMGF